MFAGPYPSSPSSAFGHLFLLFKPDPSLNKPILLWDAINYGANVQGLNSFEQFYKGLYGSLKGSYTIIPFYEKLREYTYIESRQLWLLPIKLDPKEAELLLYNLFLLINRKFNYRFHDMNCASQIESLINKGISVNKPTSIFISPRKVLSNLKTRLGEPIYIESTENILKRLDETSFKNKEKVNASQAEILLNILEWKYFRRNTLLDENEKYQLNKLRILVLQNKKNRKINFQSYSKNFKIHSPTKYGLGFNFLKNNETEYNLMFRAGLHDFTDDYDVFPRFDDLYLIKGEVSLNKTNFFLKEFWLFDQISATPDNYISKYYSWRLGFGTEQRFVDKNQRLATGIYTSFGKTYSFFSDNLITSFLLSMNAVYIRSAGNTILTGPEVWTNIYFSKTIRMITRFEMISDIFAQNVKWQPYIKNNLVIQLSENYQLNFTGKLSQKKYTFGVKIMSYIN